MTVITRFAPSPTGLLHAGNARLALINWLFARRNGGEFILRFDDTDKERSRVEYVDGIIRDMRWLGLLWDRELFQSDRLERYQAAFTTLREAGRLYACYETAEELEYRRRRLLRAGKPPVYDRAALSLTQDQIAAFEKEQRTPHWRFLLKHEDIRFHDLVRGEQHFSGAMLSDPVLVRADETFLYMLPSCVDDVDMEITHIIRGEDHVSNSAIQCQLFEALGGTLPVFAHLPLMMGASGEGLSKRTGAESLLQLREEGVDALALNAFLARLGTSDDPMPFATMDALVADFNLERFGRAQPRFDKAHLNTLTARLLHDLPFSALAAHLQNGAVEADAIDEALWLAVRGNVRSLREVTYWCAVCYGDVALPEGCVASGAEEAFFDHATATLPEEPWNGDTWKTWTAALKEASGVRGKSLFLPLRQALTGRNHGPEMAGLLPLMGKERVLARLYATR